MLVLGSANYLYYLLGEFLSSSSSRSPRLRWSKNLAEVFGVPDH